MIGKTCFLNSVFFFAFALLVPHFPVLASVNSTASEVGLRGRSEEVNKKRLFVDTELGLLTFTDLPFGKNDGAHVYAPGMLLGLRLGGMLHEKGTLYGKLALSISGNTPCYTHGSSNRNCADFRHRFPTSPLFYQLDTPRQGVSVLFGVGYKHIISELTEQLRISVSLELLGQVIPPDSFSKDKLKQIPSTHTHLLAPHGSFVLGIVAGGGLGLEYAFFLKHFSASLDAKLYYFLTPFLPNTILGTAIAVSSSLKYTF